METATYGSEFLASKTATEQLLELRHALRYLGVCIKTKSYVFGGNRSVVTSSTVPHSGRDITFWLISSQPLPILFWWQQKCPANQTVWVKLRHRLDYRWILILSGSHEDSGNFR